MLIRKTDKLANLSPEDRAKFDAWLKKEPYRRVSLAAGPHPDGLALKTNLRALSHYFNKYLAPNPAAELADLALHNPKAAEAAATALMQQHAILALGDDRYRPFNARKFNTIARFLSRLSDRTPKKTSPSFTLYRTYNVSVPQCYTLVHQKIVPPRGCNSTHRLEPPMKPNHNPHT